MQILHQAAIEYDYTLALRFRLLPAFNDRAGLAQFSFIR